MAKNLTTKTISEEKISSNPFTIFDDPRQSKRIIGIDPGKSGGIAVIHYTVNGARSRVMDVIKMPETEADLANYLRRLKKTKHDTAVFLELVGSMPKQGISSTWKFAQNYGMIRGILAALRFQREFVTPTSWQGLLKCRSGGDKNVTKRKAQELFPKLNITHAIADSLLIAEFGRRIEIARCGNRRG